VEFSEKFSQFSNKTRIFKRKNQSLGKFGKLAILHCKNVENLKLLEMQGSGTKNRTLVCKFLD